MVADGRLVGEHALNASVVVATSRDRIAHYHAVRAITLSPTVIAQTKAYVGGDIDRAYTHAHTDRGKFHSEPAVIAAGSSRVGAPCRSPRPVKIPRHDPWRWTGYFIQS